MTAKLFSCLRALAPGVVEHEGDKLFLWRSAECIHLSGTDGALGHQAYFGNCEAFLVCFDEGCTRAEAEVKDLWRHGGDKELVAENKYVVIFPREKTDQHEIAIPSAKSWDRLPWPPRRPQSMVISDSAASSPTKPSKKRPASTSASSTRKRPA